MKEHSKNSPTEIADLLKADENLSAVMNTVLDGMIIINKLGLIVAFNPAASRIFGYKTEEVIGQNIKLLMPEPYQKEHDDYLQNYHDTHEAKVIGIGREVVGKRKNGGTFPMDLGVNEMHLRGELMFVGTVHDISDRKQSETDINSYIASLKHSNAELDEFAYIASHDLKEPIRGLANNATFMKEDYAEILPPGAIKRLDRMIYLCQRMESFTDDLLYFSHVGKKDFTVKEVNITELAKETINSLQEKTNFDNVTVKIQEDLPNIICDKILITEVLNNLIKNAIKFNDKDTKKIEIGCLKKSTPHSAPTFFVKDNGIGISKEHHQDIFRIFKRLNFEEDTVKGTGVGLSFVKKIIERQGGEVWLESKPGKGTTFYFTLHNKGEKSSAFNFAH